MLQYSGFGSAEATNERFKFLVSQGQTGLSTAFDLPPQLGYDSDSERTQSEVGRVGVRVSTIANMQAYGEFHPKTIIWNKEEPPRENA
jgi:methylmalonyl-CoA mutase N-terminal domain/subunit